MILSPQAGLMEFGTPPRSEGAFTLIELILSLAIAGIVLVAIGTALFGALKLHDASVNATGQTAPVDRAISIMKADLKDIVPMGKLAGIMGTDATGSGMSVTPALEIFTGSAVVGEDLPWGDVQRIDYALQTPTNRTFGPGLSLIRGVTRNLLSSNSTTLPEQQTLLENVSTLKFTFYDGTNWNDTWSTTLSNIPLAIRVSIALADNGGARSAQSPVQFTVPVVSWAATNSITNQISGN